MKTTVTIQENGVLQFDNAKIVFRNFAGRPSKFNTKGDRNFSIIIPDMETAQKLTDYGWNVKIRDARDEDDEPFIHLPVKVNINDRGPAMYLKSGSADPVRLDEESVECLDEIAISSVDLDVRPYDWDINGKTGRTAYLLSIYVIQDITDRFYERMNRG